MAVVSVGGIGQLSLETQKNLNIVFRSRMRGKLELPLPSLVRILVEI